MQRIKLLQITHDLAIGGLQRVVVTLCKTLDRSKFDVSVLCLRAQGAFLPELQDAGIPVTLIEQPAPGKTDYLSFLKVASHIRRLRPQVVHTHNTQPLMDGVLGSILAGGVKRIVHTDHARSFPDKRRYMFAEWFLSHFVYRMVGVSDHTTANLAKYERIPRRKLITIPNGIDPKPFEIIIDKKKKRRELGLPPSGPVLGCCVRLTEQKGITYLLKAMPKIVESFPDASLIIAGEGPLEQDLRCEAEGLGITKNVFFLGPRLDIPELLKLFDMYVLPSLWEGLPMIILEAMAAGCPVVASDVGGVGKAVVHGRNAKLVKSTDVHSLASAIAEYLDDAQGLDDASVSARALFEKGFSAQAMVSRYEGLSLQGMEA